MTITLNKMTKISVAFVIGAAIVLTIAVSSVAQAQNDSTRDSFNRAIADRSGAVDVLKRGQRAQQLRQRGNMARNVRKATKAANYPKTRRYAKYGRRCVMPNTRPAWAPAPRSKGADPVSIGIYSVTSPKDFGRNAAY